MLAGPDGKMGLIAYEMALLVRGGAGRTDDRPRHPGLGPGCHRARPTVTGQPRRFLLPRHRGVRPRRGPSWPGDSGRRRMLFACPGRRLLGGRRRRPPKRRPQRHYQRERVDVPAHLPGSSHLRLQVGSARHHGQLRRHRIRRGPCRPGREHRHFAGWDSPIPSAEEASFKGKEVLYFPVVTGPVTLSYHLSDVPRRRLSARSSRASSTVGSRPGTTPRSRPTIPMSRCPPRRSRSLSAPIRPALPPIHRVPGGGRGCCVAARHQLNHPLASRQPERQRQRRGSADRQIHPRRDRIRGLRDGQGRRADLRLGQEQGRQLRGAVAESAALAASQVILKPNETFSAIWAGGRGSYPITYQSWDLVYAKQPNANDANCSGRTSATCSERGRNYFPSSATRRCPPASTSRPKRS